MSYLTITHTVNDVVEYVKRQFGDEAAIQITSGDIIRWINSAQDEIFRISEPLKTSATTDLVAGQSQYAFPDNVMRIQSIYINGKPIPQRGVQEAEEYALNDDPTQTQQATPLFWWEWAGTLNFYPTPDTDGSASIKFNYIKAPTKVTGTTDDLSVPDAYYNRVLEYVMGQAYELDDNLEAASVKGNQFNQNLKSYEGTDDTADNVYPTITILEEDIC